MVDPSFLKIKIFKKFKYSGSDKLKAEQKGCGQSKREKELSMKRKIF